MCRLMEKWFGNSVARLRKSAGQVSHNTCVSIIPLNVGKIPLGHHENDFFVCSIIKLFIL